MWNAAKSSHFQKEMNEKPAFQMSNINASTAHHPRSTCQSLAWVKQVTLAVENTIFSLWRGSEHPHNAHFGIQCFRLVAGKWIHSSHIWYDSNHFNWGSNMSANGNCDTSRQFLFAFVFHILNDCVVEELWSCTYRCKFICIYVFCRNKNVFN